MKKTVILIAALSVYNFAFAQKKADTFTGEIMDKQCAQMGSHENMMKAEGAKNAKECTLACLKNGDTLVLFDSSAKKVYPIDSDKKVREYAGERVQINGDYDSDQNVLRVKSVAPAH